MSANVGLTTPRGSGTSGYVQKNLSSLRPNTRTQYTTAQDNENKRDQFRRKPNEEILEHERKREVEVKCLELRDKLEDEGKDEADIDEEVEGLRRKLLAELENSAGGSSNRAVKGWETHELAQRKLEQNEKFEIAVGLKKAPPTGPSGGNNSGWGGPPPWVKRPFNEGRLERDPRDRFRGGGNGGNGGPRGGYQGGRGDGPVRGGDRYDGRGRMDGDGRGPPPRPQGDEERPRGREGPPGAPTGPRDRGFNRREPRPRREVDSYKGEGKRRTPSPMDDDDSRPSRPRGPRRGSPTRRNVSKSPVRSRSPIRRRSVDSPARSRSRSRSRSPVRRRVRRSTPRSMSRSPTRSRSPVRRRTVSRSRSRTRSVTPPPRREESRGRSRSARGSRSPTPMSEHSN